MGFQQPDYVLSMECSSKILNLVLQEWKVLPTRIRFTESPLI